MSTNVIYDRDTSNDLVYDGSSFVTPTFYVSNLSDGTTTYAIKDAEARTSLASKQDTLVSGTNIKTINSTSLLGSGNISITGLPSQTSQSGKFLTTNGTSASWSNAPGATMTYDSTTKTLTIS